ncbi:MAG: FKBP-type peptidyl-prolyl cis-trans isomerase [Lachnospiraceae bacterium]
MKTIGKLCTVLLCLTVVFGGCARSGSEGSEQTAYSEQTACSEQTVSAEEASSLASMEENIEAGKGVLTQDPEQEITFTFDYDPGDYVELDEDYRSIVFSEEDLKVSEEEIQNQIDSLLTEHAELEKVTDRGALAGDILKIDLSGILDGETIYDEKDFQLELGSEAVVPGFDEQLEGAMAGDQISLDLEYPEDYGDETLNGKTIHFDVTVHEVDLSVVPDYTDDFVKEYTGYDTIKAYEAAIKELLEDSARSDAVALWLDEHSTMKACPDSLKQECEQNMLEYFRLIARYNGMDMEELLEVMNYDSEEALLEDGDNAAAVEASARDILAYQYVAGKENLRSTVRDYVDYLENYAQEQGYEDAEELLDYYTEEEMRTLYMKQLVTDCILNYAAVQ